MKTRSDLCPTSGSPLALNTTNVGAEKVVPDYHEARRPGQDEPPPAPERPGVPAVWDLVSTDMRERDEVGRRRYGVPLQPWNGRNALNDAYQEVLDLAVNALLAAGRVKVDGAACPKLVEALRECPVLLAAGRVKVDGAACPKLVEALRECPVAPGKFGGLKPYGFYLPPPGAARAREAPRDARPCMAGRARRPGGEDAGRRSPVAHDQPVYVTPSGDATTDVDEAGYLVEELLWVGDASGQWQTGKHSRRRA